MATVLNGPGLASGSDFESLAELLAFSFEEKAPLSRNLLKLLSETDKTVVFRKEGCPVSVAFLREATLHIAENTYSAYWFFGAATHPDHRRKGYMEQIIRYCRSLSEERGIDFLVLAPRNNELYQYFSRFGFRANFYQKTTQLEPEQLAAMVEKMDGSEASPEEGPGFVPTAIPKVREAALRGGAFLEYDASTLQFLLFDHLSRGGKTILLEDGYALYDLSTDDTGETTLHVKELLGTESVGKLLRKVSEVEADRYILDLPAFDSIRGGRTSTGRAGMDLAVSKEAVRAERTMKNAYLGLTIG